MSDVGALGPPPGLERQIGHEREGAIGHGKPPPGKRNVWLAEQLNVKASRGGLGCSVLVQRPSSRTPSVIA
jgi:hypothetical protein